MIMRMKTIAIAALAMAVQVWAGAQERSAALPAAHSLEFFGGVSSGFFPVATDKGTVHGLTSGSDWGFRYTFFFSENWGIYTRIGVMELSTDDVNFFGAANKADGGKYRYRSGYSSWRASLDPVFTIGAARRIPLGKMTIVPRAGIGLADIMDNEYYFERIPRDGSTGAEYFSSKPLIGSKSADYLMDQSYVSSYMTRPVISADCQVDFSLSKWLYVFVQPGFVWSPLPYQVERSKTGSKAMYSPANWVEAVSYAGAKDQYTIDPESKVSESVRTVLTPFFNLDFGVGITFGPRKK